MSSIDAAIRKAKKLIAEKQKQSRTPKVFESHDGEFPEAHTGMVIIYSQETREEAMAA